MSIFSSGQASWPNQGAIAALKYLPRPRVPYKPSVFGRENVTEKDLAKLWARGRIGSGHELRNYFSPEATESRYEFSVKKIPRHELEKFMPNIDIGPKSMVTPTSLMAVRDGHKITHDLVMSYDQTMGTKRDGVWRQLDENKVNPQDDSNVGIHGDTIGCRSKIYRWMRRGPQANERALMSRDILKLESPTAKQGAELEMPLYRKIIRLAKKGNVKTACEEYRRCTYIPPVQVYRALLAALVPGGLIADAVAIYTDGDKLHGLTRDTECYMSLMQCAIQAGNVPQVMWIFNEMQGEYFRSDIMRTRIEPIWMHKISLRALEFLLDAEQEMEARSVYNFLVHQNPEPGHAGAGGAGTIGGGQTGAGYGANGVRVLPTNDSLYRTGLDTDLFVRQGTNIRALLEEGKKVELKDLTPTLGNLNLEKAIDQICESVAQVAFDALPSHARKASSNNKPTAQWLMDYYSDVDVRGILRLARFVKNGRDLMATDQEEYCIRASNWLDLLSDASLKESRPLPYLFKTKPSSVNPNVRIIGSPNDEESRRAGLTPTGAMYNNHGLSLSPSELGFTFNYKPGMRAVMETVDSPYGKTARLGTPLPTRIVQREIECSTLFGEVEEEVSGEDEGLQMISTSTASSSPAALPSSAFRLHDSVFADDQPEMPPTIQVDGEATTGGSAGDLGGLEGVSNEPEPRM